MEHVRIKIKKEKIFNKDNMAGEIYAWYIRVKTLIVMMRGG